MQHKEMFKVHLLQDESIRTLYQKRISLNMERKGKSTNINEEWDNIKQIIIQAASEALGTRRIRNKRTGLQIWNDDIEKIIKDKKTAYLKYLQLKTAESKVEYKYRCALARREVRKIKRNSWEKYVSDIEHDVHGRQEKAYKILKHLNKTEKDNLHLTTITEEKWLQYYKELWTTSDKHASDIMIDINELVDPITLDELLPIIQNAKNKKSPGSDNINMELIKYAPIPIYIRLLDFFNLCWRTGYIPEEWGIAKIIPIFKKGDRNDCDNY